MDETCKLPTDALTARLYEIRKEERTLLVEFLQHLAEIDRRGAALAMGFPSLFVFCVDYLGLSRGSAYKFPDRGLEAVLHEAIRLALDVVRKRRRGAGKATSTEPPPPDSRYIPAAIRHAVWKRDGGRCAFIGPDGRRCNSRYQVQAHHRDPFGRKGPTTIDNVSLRCSAHNLHEAERDYGRDHIARKIRESRQPGGRASEPLGSYGRWQTSSVGPVWSARSWPQGSLRWLTTAASLQRDGAVSERHCDQAAAARPRRPLTGCRGRRGSRPVRRRGGPGAGATRRSSWR